MSEEEIPVDLPPELILRDPLINKGIAFTEKEREELGLNGFLPSMISTIESQVMRRYLNFIEKKNEGSKFRMLKNLRERNRILYFRMILEHAEELLPYIYTPMVGDAAEKYSLYFTYNQGIFFNYKLTDQIDQVVQNIPNRDVKVIVITDGGRVLGLGDMGAGGMVIPIGKLDLYTVFAGFHPSEVLPVTLDVGTDNAELLNDPLYVGERHHRITGDAYYSHVDKVVKALMKRYPRALLQWEDFPKDHARKLLDRYRDTYLSFNDDIQGTAAATLSGLMTGLGIAGESIKEAKIAILGGGSAGMGVAEIIVQAKMREGRGESDAKKDLFIVDVSGLLVEAHISLDVKQKQFAHDPEELGWEVRFPEKISLSEVVRFAKPHVLIGLSSQSGAFSQEIVEEMASHHRHPIILPLSNPTHKSEAVPRDLLHWTKGKALVATGSPFDPVEYQGKLIEIPQCNNVFVFPGLGLGLSVSGAKTVTDELFLVAVDALSQYNQDQQTKRLFPKIANLREVSRSIAIAVAKVAFERGLAQKNLQGSVEEMIDNAIWYPRYPIYKRR